ncbi:MAG: ABC transporter ATP-binding protein [Bacteroidota bacterium]|nr:ABC transporter ATP-binding protein [Bacteroidota bacterium]
MEELIRTKDVAKIYKLGKVEIKALQSITLNINVNEYVSLIGASGSGKSTLMNILGCLDTPTRGEYFLKGYNVSELTDDGLAKFRNKEIGFVFQSFNLIPRMSALENVSLPLIYSGIKKKERFELAREQLNEVGLGDRMDHKPNELSGGQKQRVALARALINNPSIILADEPTGNLDSKTSFEILNLIEEIHDKGNTIILVTHEKEISQRAHRVIRLVDGLVDFDKKN